MIHLLFILKMNLTQLKNFYVHLNTFKLMSPSKSKGIQQSIPTGFYCCAHIERPNGRER